MKKFSVAILLVTAVSLFMSCGSKPAPEEETPTAPVVEEVQIEEPAVEETVVEEPVVIDNSALFTEIDGVRDAVLAAGTDGVLDILEKLDADYEALKSKDGDVSKEAKDLIAKYQALLDYLKAFNAKKVIDDNGYAVYDQVSYDQGVEALEGVKEALMSDDVLDSKYTEKTRTAYSSFNTVLITAYKKLARAERDAAFEAKKNADSVKAGVSQKEKYNQAADSFKTGDSCYSMQNPEKAIEYYRTAKEIFTELYEDVSAKRAAAQAAIDAAKKSVEDSANFAEEADAKSPVTKQIEGIEDEDTVLLEEDEYENPEDSEVEIAAKLDGEEYDEEETTVVVEAVVVDESVVEETEAAVSDESAAEETEVALGDESVAEETEAAVETETEAELAEDEDDDEDALIVEALILEDEEAEETDSEKVEE